MADLVAVHLSAEVCEVYDVLRPTDAEGFVRWFLAHSLIILDQRDFKILRVKFQAYMRTRLDPAVLYLVFTAVGYRASNHFETTWLDSLLGL